MHSSNLNDMKQPCHEGKFCWPEACCGLGPADISKAGFGGQSSEPTWDRQRKEETTTQRGGREGAAVLMPVSCELMRDGSSHYDTAPFASTLVAAHRTRFPIAIG